MNNYFGEQRKKIEQRTLEILSTEKTGGGLQATLWIILVLVLAGCFTLSFYNKFANDKFTYGMLITINVISILGIFIALAYGFHSAIVIKNSGNAPSNNLIGSDTYSPINTITQPE